MIVLDNGDLIEGDSTSASETDFVISGLDNNALKQLADGQLASSKGTIYTADSTDVISSIILVNTGAAHNHVNLYLKPSGGTSRRLIPKDLQLESGYSLYFDGAKVMVMDLSGGIIYGQNVSDVAYAASWDGVTGVAPSKNAVYDKMQTKLENVVEDTTPQLGGPLDMNEQYCILSTGLADAEFCGITVEGTAGATLAFGDCCYFKATDSQWYLAKADVTATSGIVKLGMCVLAGNDNDPTRMLLYGNIRANSKFPSFSPLSGQVYVSAADVGLITSTAPTGTTDFVVRVVGRANTADELFFNPSEDYVELA
jgi:hypothetical protein